MRWKFYTVLVLCVQGAGNAALAPYPDGLLESENRAVKSYLSPDALFDPSWIDENAELFKNGVLKARGRQNVSTFIDKDKQNVTHNDVRKAIGLYNVMMTERLTTKTHRPAEGVSECCSWARFESLSFNKDNILDRIDIYEQDGSWEEIKISTKTQ